MWSALSGKDGVEDLRCRRHQVEIEWQSTLLSMKYSDSVEDIKSIMSESKCALHTERKTLDDVL